MPFPFNPFSGKRKPTTNRFGESVLPHPAIQSAHVRENAARCLEVCMDGIGLVGSANGPQITIDGQPSTCVCFENETLVALVPPGIAPRARVIATYGSLVCGDFLIKTKPGARVRRWSIRTDDRLRKGLK